MIKLKEWAKQVGISYKTAHRLFRAAKIKGIQFEKNGTILVDESQFFISNKEDGKFNNNAPVDLTLPVGNSNCENLELCCNISKYLVLKELEQDNPNKQIVISGLKSLLQSIKLALDNDLDDDLNNEAT